MQKIIAGALVAIVALLCAIVFLVYRGSGNPGFTTHYQAVLLSNGQVYFGKLEQASGQYPVLRDVYYIVSQTNPETRQTANMLVRRGKELHGPEYMVLNRQSILLIEPVKEDSQVAKLIAEQKKQAN